MADHSELFKARVRRGKKEYPSNQSPSWAVIVSTLGNTLAVGVLQCVNENAFFIFQMQRPQTMRKISQNH